MTQKIKQKYGDLVLIPESSIISYKHYSPDLLNKFYETIDIKFSTNQGYIFPDGKFAEILESHIEAFKSVEDKFKLKPKGIDHLLYHGCIRVGYMDGCFNNQVYIETLFTPTSMAHKTILDFIYNQKHVDAVVVDAITNKSYEKRLKHIISRALPHCEIS